MSLCIFGSSLRLNLFSTKIAFTCKIYFKFQEHSIYTISYRHCYIMNENNVHKKAAEIEKTTCVDSIAIKSNSPKLPLLLPIKKTVEGNIKDLAGQHGGRVRTFQHERGNWATHIFIPVDTNLLRDAAEKICENDVGVKLETCQNLHISLSRTVILQYHLIDSFTKSLENSLFGSERFALTLSDLNVYANEDRTRTFLALNVSDLYYEKLQRLLSKVDAVMDDYKLPTFYEKPKFHISFLWCLGDKVEMLNRRLKALIRKAYSVFDINETFIFDVQGVQCNIGNKQYTFKLM